MRLGGVFNGIWALSSEMIDGFWGGRWSREYVAENRWVFFYIENMLLRDCSHTFKFMEE